MSSVFLVNDRHKSFIITAPPFWGDASGTDHRRSDVDSRRVCECGSSVYVIDPFQNGISFIWCWYRKQIWSPNPPSSAPCPLLFGGFRFWWKVGREKHERGCQATRTRDEKHRWEGRVRGTRRCRGGSGFRWGPRHGGWGGQRGWRVQVRSRRRGRLGMFASTLPSLANWGRQVGGGEVGERRCWSGWRGRVERCPVFKLDAVGLRLDVEVAGDMVYGGCKPLKHALPIWYHDGEEFWLTGWQVCQW